MSATIVEGDPVEWEWPCTLRDLLAVDALPDEVRASVERYLRRSQTAPAGDAEDSEYTQGWEDGVRAMQDEISDTWVPAPRRRKQA